MKGLEQRGYSQIVHLTTGGEGNVYTCEKEGEKYIAKVIAMLDPEQLNILKSINALRSEYFPKIIEILNNEDQTIIIRKYIEGATLADEIKKNNFYSFQRAKEMIFEVCNALRALHTMKPNPVIYRDLKPENIIITPNGKVKLIDFGIARYYKQESVRDTVLAGTKGYTAPEVMTGMQSDVRSDIYSIGLVFYEMLSGKSLQDPPYQIRPVTENNEFIPAYVDEIIAKATDINQMNRYESIDEFVYELENIKEIKAKQKNKKRRRRLFVALAIVVALAVAAVLTIPMLTAERVEILLKLEFDNEDDLGYVIDYEHNIETMFAYRDGYVSPKSAGGLMFNYALRGGMLVHYRVQFKPNTCGCVALSSMEGNEIYSYRISPDSNFLAVFDDPTQGKCLETGDQKLQGLPIANNNQFIDVILYISEQDDAVYAFVCDEDAIAYTAYQIPEKFRANEYYAESAAFFENEDDYINIDSVSFAEGSVKQYLAENTAAYHHHNQRIDEFLSIETSSLPEMVLVSLD